MSIDELRAACVRSNENAIINELGRAGMLILKLGARRNHGQFVRLCGRRGPKGRVVGTEVDGTVIADFKADEILKWLDANPNADEEPGR